MKFSEQLCSLNKIVELYDVLIIDIWGVIYDGISPYKYVIETINILNKSKTIIFLSNTPRPSDITFKKLCELGVDISKDQIYTSGDAVREQLVLHNDEIFKNIGRKFYHLGSERNQDILNGIEVEEVKDINIADFVLLTAYIDEDEDLAQFDTLLLEAKTKNLPLICANPDEQVANGSSIRYCAGTFAKRYHDMGGATHYYGKPDIKVYRKVFEKLNLDKSRILMIGDTLETDILGANKANIDSLLVLTGNGQKSYNNISNILTPKWILQKLCFEGISKSI